MATLHLTPTTVTVELTTAEKVLGLIRDVTIPRTAVTEAAVEADPLAAVSGLRAPGLAIPGRRKVGTWRGRGRRTLVSVTAGVPAVRLRLAGHRYDAIVVSTQDAARWVEDLQPEGR